MMLILLGELKAVINPLPEKNNSHKKRSIAYIVGDLHGKRAKKTYNYSSFNSHLSCLYYYGSNQ